MTVVDIQTRTMRYMSMYSIAYLLYGTLVYHVCCSSTFLVASIIAVSKYSLHTCINSYLEHFSSGTCYLLRQALAMPGL